MTDIEQQIAQATQTGKSTAILQDAEQVTEPLQIYPFVVSFFRAYSPTNRAAYETAYKSDRYTFAKMLIGFTDPPSFSAIMNNGDYFVYWDQSRARLEAWFAMLREDLEVDPASTGILNNLKKAFKDFFSSVAALRFTEEVRRGADEPKNANENALAYIVTHMFDALDRQYRSFQRQLIDAENRELPRMSWLSDADRDANMNWVNRMDEFLKHRDAGSGPSRASAAGATTSQAMLDSVAYFAEHVLAASPLAVAARMPIGVEVDATAPAPRVVSVVNPRTAATATATATATGRTARSTAATPARGGGSGGSGGFGAATAAQPEESIAEHYRRIIADFGAHMMELFRSFAFPPIFTLDALPSFTVAWSGYVDLAYNSFRQLAAERFDYLQQKGKSVGRAPPDWTQDRIFADPQAAALFAEFVGYKKNVPALTVAPAQYVQRTNATYHYAINNMSLRFVSLYDHMVRIDSGSGSRKRGRWP